MIEKMIIFALNVEHRIATAENMMQKTNEVVTIVNLILLDEMKIEMNTTNGDPERIRAQMLLVNPLRKTAHNPLVNLLKQRLIKRQ